MCSDQSYQGCLDWLFQQFPSYQKIGSKAYKPTLDNTRNLLRIIGNPEKQLKFIHIAGSNGKGSVSAYLASLSKESGYTAGLFTSPHIKDFRERIRVNGEMIPKSSVVEYVQQIRSAKLSFSPSFFEMTLAMALDHFAKSNCDLVVLETGLGGRLDATNVVQSEMSAITTISLEHQHILGDSLEEIAIEKAGIIKNGRPVVLGNIPLRAKREIIKIAQEKDSSVLDFVSKEWNEIQLATKYQRINLSIADEIVKALNKENWKFDTLKWPVAIDNLRMNTGFFGRFEIINEKPIEIWDVSHNAEGIENTLEAFREMFSGNLNIVIGLSADKNIAEIVKILPEKSNIFVTTFESERSASLSQLKSEFAAREFSKKMYFADPQDALNTAKSLSSSEDGIIVFGSFFLFEKLF
jgi:dihydrofolate synthase/folylpolyglutamate synthase